MIAQTHVQSARTKDDIAKALFIPLVPCGSGGSGGGGGGGGGGGVSGYLMVKC